MGRRAGVLLLLLVPSCLDSGLTVCGNLVCPAGTSCTPARDRCVSTTQVNACIGKAEEESCTLSGAAVAVCRSGVCVESRCGDGVLDPGEECDDGAANGTPADHCSSTCQIERCGNGVRDPTEGCDCGDGTVALPTGCNQPNSDQSSATCRSDCQLPGCGDGVVAGLEDCEPGVAFTQTCVGLHFYKGTLACNASCRFDVAGCVGRCGDGVKNGSEACDGTDLGMTTCTTLGYYNAEGLKCNEVCAFDDSGCTGKCGDGVINGDEQCDGSDLGGATCRSLGFYDDTPLLGCTGRCAFDTSKCTGFCGDGILNGAEECDASPPSGKSCFDFGFDVGRLSCSRTCTPLTADCGLIGWKPVTDVPSTVNLFALWGSGPKDAFAVGATADFTAPVIFHFDGKSWSPMTLPAEALGAYLLGVWGSGPTDVYAVGNIGAGIVLHYDGITWTSSSSANSLSGVWGSGSDDVFVVGDSGTILHWDGTSPSPSPSPMPSGTSETLLGVWGSGPKDVFAVGTGGTILHYDGNNWSPLGSGTTAALYSVWGRAANDVFVAGDLGTILHCSGGPSCAPMNSGTTTQGFGRLWGAAQEVFAVGSDVATGTIGAIYHYDGRGWQPMVVNAGAFGGVWGSSVEDVFVSGIGGLLHYGGVGWLASPLLSNAVWGLNADQVFTADDASTVCDYTHEFDGTSWQNQCLSTTTPENLNAVWGTSASDVKVAGPDRIFRLLGGQFVVDHSAGANGLWGSGPSDWWAVSDIIAHWDGSQWREFPDPVSGGLLWGGDKGNGVWGSGPADVFAVGTSGKSLHYDGDAWSRLPTGTSLRLNAVWGSGAKDVFTVGANGTILHFDGAAWSPLTSGTTTDLGSVSGTGPTDVFAASSSNPSLTPLALHYDGEAWVPMRVPSTAPTGRFGNSVWAARSGVFFVSPALGELARSCDTIERNCRDQWDNDCDGLLNCADPDCAADPYCRLGGLCQDSLPIPCNVSVPGNTAGRMAWLDHYSCDPRIESGKEAYYRLTPATTGSVSVQLANMTADLDLIVLHANASGACDPLGACVAASATSAPTESLTFTATAGQSYFLVVDGYQGATGGFTLQVSCP
jgi:cysteine-rich repeat protein